MAKPKALVTGAASGIGQQLVLQLSLSGYDITMLDMNAQALEETAAAARKNGSDVQTAVVDVTNDQAQQQAFQNHMDHFGRLDLAVLNAGVAEWRSFYTLLDKSWKKVVDVDLTAVMSGVQAASKCMIETNTAGVIISVASAAGIFPVPNSPVYAAAKGGLVHFTRSVGAPLQKKGVKVYAMCPEFVDTPLVRKLIADAPDTASQSIDMSRPLLTSQQVVEVIMKLAEGQHAPGTCLLLMQGGKLVNPFERKKAGAPPDPFQSAKLVNTAVGKLAPSPQARAALVAWAGANKTGTYRKIEVCKLSHEFREATRTVSVQLPSSIPDGHVLVRRVFVGINASDINYTAGRYHANRKEAEAALPYPAGFEGVGIVAAAGLGVKGLQVGDAVASMQYGEFSEYSVQPAKVLLAVPAASPEVLALLVSGLTASIALEVAARMGSGQTVLVTAAAGGTGQFAVQLAKLAGNHVIATCGGADKAAMLRQLGADRCIDYKTENLKDVLKQDYPKGVDVVYEGVGGDWFGVAVDALAPCGRLVIIGMMSQYKDGWPVQQYPGLAEKLLFKSATVAGFFLLRHTSLFSMEKLMEVGISGRFSLLASLVGSHLARLLSLLGSGRLHAEVDPVRFVGLDSIPDAVERLQSGRSRGKVVVQVGADAPLPPQATAASKL